MEAMIKYYEGETLGLGGKTAGSPGESLQAHAPASPLLLHDLYHMLWLLIQQAHNATARPVCSLPPVQRFRQSALLFFSRHTNASRCALNCRRKSNSERPDWISR